MIKARKQNSTLYPINYLMTDSQDGKTAKTGLTPTVTLSKNGGAFAAAAGAVSEIGNGWYSLAGNATDRNTLGELCIHAAASGADPADIQYSIVNFDPFIFKPPVSLAVADCGGNLPAEVKALDDIDFGATMKVSLNAATPEVTVSDKTGFELTSDYDSAKTAAQDSTVAKDATVMKAADYTAPPSAVQNREEMDSNSTKLAHLDADISKGLDAAGVRSAVGLTSANLETVLDIISSQILTDANIVSDCETAIVNSALTIDSIQSGLATQQGVNDALALMEEKIPSTVDIIDAIHDLPDPWAKELPGSYPAGSAGKILGSYLPGSGTGSVNYTYTLTETKDGIDTGVPIPGADIRVSTDIAGTTIIASSATNTYGQITFLLDPGTYYFWRQKTGWTFTDPEEVVVT